MKNCLTLLLGGLLCQAVSAQCLNAQATVTHAMTSPGAGVWLGGLALMAGIVWRRQDH